MTSDGLKDCETRRGAPYPSKKLHSYVLFLSFTNLEVQVDELLVLKTEHSCVVFPRRRDAFAAEGAESASLTPEPLQAQGLLSARTVSSACKTCPTGRQRSPQRPYGLVPVHARNLYRPSVSLMRVVTPTML